FHVVRLDVVLNTGEPVDVIRRKGIDELNSTYKALLAPLRIWSGATTKIGKGDQRAYPRGPPWRFNLFCRIASPCRSRPRLRLTLWIAQSLSPQLWAPWRSSPWSSTSSGRSGGRRCRPSAGAERPFS